MALSYLISLIILYKDVSRFLIIKDCKSFKDLHKDFENTLNSSH